MSTHPDHPAPVPEPVSASGDAAVRCLPKRRGQLRMLSTRTAASRLTRRRTGPCHAVYYRP